MPLSTSTLTHELSIEIGGMPILLRTDDPVFAQMTEQRYGEFVTVGTPNNPVSELEIELTAAPLMIGDSGRVMDGDAEVSVRMEAGHWIIERGDFRAEWDPECRRGWVRQTASPYALDGVLRILHSLILAQAGGFLVHAASAVRNGRAYVFAGVSGAGKTTLARMAPPDVMLLTDEISYVRDTGHGMRDTGTKSAASPEFRFPNPVSRFPAFHAFGTPFAGELARLGRKIQAPLAALFLLEQGPENCVDPLTSAQAARELLRHVLFFAHDEELVRLVFLSVCEFVKHVPVRRLTFTPDARVWELMA